MSQTTQQSTTDAQTIETYRDEWIIYNYDSGNARMCEDKTEAEQKKADAMAEFSYDTEPEIFGPGELPAELQRDDSDETVPCEHCGDGVTPSDAIYGPNNKPYHKDCENDTDGDQSEAQTVEAEVVDHTEETTEDTHNQNLQRAEANQTRPALNEVEEQARAIIQSLDGADMNRLVWDPTAAQVDVPYDPSNLPYDTLEPSAEAFDLFASVMEGVRGVEYSVVDVDFEKSDETLNCTVTIHKTGDGSDKQLIGVKTRERHGNDLDHWRERLFSKARRNALKQDIPPTLVSTLLQRYERLQE